MGVGEFLSSKANNEWVLSERKREEWEMDNYPEGEIEEVRKPTDSTIPRVTSLLTMLPLCAQMIDIYINKGLSREDATVVIKTLSKYKDFFVDLMMQQELELQVSRFT